MAGIEGLLAGHTLAGRYRIEEVIGRGGMAAVYRAFDETLHRSVAVKVITVSAPDEGSRERLRERFHREARAAARLQHPNVVAVHDFGTDPHLGLDFLVMEYLHGEDLARHVARNGSLPLGAALRILREAADGLAAGHRAGLIHRDVKPGNLFLADEDSDRPRVRVLDFGIARIIAGDESLTPLTRGQAPLSPSYASPEQLAGSTELTPASDVYSLGIIGYELLSGERLFAGTGARTARDEIVPLRERSPEVPEGAAAVITRALAPDPDARYADAGEMARALWALQTGAAAAAPPPPAPPVAAPAPVPTPEPRPEPPAPRATTRRPRKGGRRGMLMAGALLVAAVLALAWWALDDGGPAVGPTADARVPASGTAAPAAEEPTGAATEQATANEPVSPPTAPAAGAADRTAAPAPAAAAPPPASPAPAVRRGAPVSGGDAVALNREGIRLLQRGDAAGAAARFGRAVELSPGNAYYRNNLGWALYRAGDLERAAAELARTVELDPGRDIAYANIGEVRLARGDTAGAISAYQRFLQLNTDPRRERIAREKLRRIGG